MAQAGSTPIQLYRTTTASAQPAAGNLAAGELAINLTDKKLYAKDASNNVFLLADASSGGTTAANLAGGAAGSLPYQTGANATTFLGIGAADRVLTSSGTAPQWVTSLTGLTGVSSSGLTNTSLTSGRLVYSTTGGAQTDSANLTFDGSILTINSVAVGRGGSGVSTNTAVGTSALGVNTTGARNTAVGTEALYTNTTSNDSTALGYRALYLSTGTRNTAVGSNALDAVTTGTDNVAVGADSLTNNTGSSNVAVGARATAVTNAAALQANTTGIRNTAVGAGALSANTTQSDSVAIGAGAAANANASRIIAIGSQALAAATGADNVAIGGPAVAISNQGALFYTTSGTKNVAIGNGAGYTNTTGSNHVAVGWTALFSNTTGGNNVALGYEALRQNTTASNNTAVGYQAGYSTTTGAENVFIGYQAGYGGLGTSVAIGYRALYTGGVGASVAIGREALRDNTANGNTAIGYHTLRVNTTGTNNVAIGANDTADGTAALDSNTTGSYNVAIGNGALTSNTTSSSNVAVGANALYTNTGANNTGVGPAAGSSITTGSKNTILGAYNGNQGGLDIRTSSNNIVLSDGDGNPRLHINSSGNAGIGAVPPSVWQSGKALEVGFVGTGLWAFQQGSSYRITNAYYDGAWKYGGTGGASLYAQEGGLHTWSSAASGSAGGAITFTPLLIVDRNKTLALQGATSQTGAGITFPATQSASSDANTLDDYEEGTWTATLKGSTTDPTTPVTATGTYTKIGRQVFVNVYFDNINTTGAAGNVSLLGLPFSSAATVHVGSALSYLFDLNTGTSLNAYISASSTGVSFFSSADDAAWQALQHNAGSGRYLVASVTYTVA